MKRPRWIFAILLLLISTAALAQKPQVMPQSVADAQYVYVTSYDGPSWSSNVKQDDKRAVGDVIAALQKWGRYTVVFQPDRADIVIAVQKRPSSDTFAVYQGKLPGPQSIPLWREIRAGGLDSNELPLMNNFRKAVEAATPSKR
jgi:hypothetical protein